MDDMRHASSRIACLIVYMGKRLQQRRGWFPTTFTHHIHATQLLLDTPPKRQSFVDPCKCTLWPLSTWQVSCGIVHCDSSWVLLAVGQQLSSDHKGQSSWEQPSARPGTSQGCPLLMSVIPLTVHWCHTLNRGVCERQVSPLGLLPIWLVQMTVLVPAAHQLALCSQTVTPSFCCYSRSIIFLLQ